MASDPARKNVDEITRRLKVARPRLFLHALQGLGKNKKLDADPSEILGTNFSSQNSESEKKPSSDETKSKHVAHSEKHSESSHNSKRHSQDYLISERAKKPHEAQSKPVVHSGRHSATPHYLESAKKPYSNETKGKHEVYSGHSANSRIQMDTCKNVDKYNLKKYPNIQNNNKKSNYKAYNDREQNFIERKQSHEPETEDNTQEVELEDCSLEIFEVNTEDKHHREIGIPESDKGLKISFENKLPSNSVSVLPVPINNSPLQSESSVNNIPDLLPSNRIGCCSSPEPKVCSLPKAPGVCHLPPTSEVHNLSSSLTCSLAPSAPSLFSSLLLNTPSGVSENLNHTDCNYAYKLLSSGEDSFIPPPVLPPDVNNNDSSNTSPERKKNVSISDDSQSTEDIICPEENEYLSIMNPEHLEAITNYITAVVKERAVLGHSANTVVRDLNILFKDYFQGNIIDVYGSYDTGLAISTSDINLVLMSDVSLKKSFMFEIYKVLAKELEKYHVHPFEEKISTHQTKINFSHPDTGINCQLAYLGKYKENIFKMGKFLKWMSMKDERVKTLIIAAKIWAEYLAINEVEDGKLHPVGYALLVIHFLQQCENPILPLLQSDNCDYEVGLKNEIPNKSSIGELWIAFLKYFSTFNWKQNVVTVNSKEIVSKKSKQWENYWLAIEDPFTGKNIAESVVHSDVAEYMKACFKSSCAYFCNPPETVSLSSSSGDNNGESPSYKYEFSFQQCIIDQSDALCDICEEIDDICDECKGKIYVQPMASVPKMTDSFLSKIKEALTTIYNKYMLTEEEINERKQFVKRLQTSVSKIYPDAEMKLFGSSNNGFGFKNSDLDICVTFKTQKINPFGVLKNIRFLLRRDKSFNHVVAIFGAQIPIIKFYYEPKGWLGDISLDNTLAVHNSELLYTYSLIDERCKVLGCALKLLAKKALIAGVTEKALSSYSYLNMVIHFLQQVAPPVLPVIQDNKFRENFRLDHIVENCNVWFCKDLDYIKREFKSENETPAEQLWLDLLDYYCSFDNNQFITIRQKETQYINDIKRSSRLFNIQDPFIETKNLGCVVSAKKAQETKSILNRARYLFRTPVKELPSGVKDIEDYFFSTMSLTGRIHKEAHCNLCGKFGHEQKECKQSYFPLRRPNFRQFHKYNSYKNRSVTMNGRPKNKPAYRKQFST